MFWKTLAGRTVVSNKKTKHVSVHHYVYSSQLVFFLNVSKRNQTSISPTNFDDVQNLPNFFPFFEIKLDRFIGCAIFSYVKNTQA